MSDMRVSRHKNIQRKDSGVVVLVLVTPCFNILRVKVAYNGNIPLKGQHLGKLSDSCKLYKGQCETSCNCFLPFEA